MFRRTLIKLFGLKLFRAGDVVIDGYNGVQKTVERVTNDRAELCWFEGSTLRRGSLLMRNLTLA